MSPEDPRHGEVRGYRAHRRDGEEACAACLSALARYKKRRDVDVLAGEQRLVPKWRMRRRVEALQRIGYSLTAINDSAGLGSRWLHTTLHMPGDMITARSFAKIDAAYRRLEGTPGPSARARRLAELRGYPSPLAWDDIDHDHAPNLGGRDDQPDPVVVDRLLAGDMSLARTATTAERRAVVAAWPRSLAELERLTGWRADRYVEREEGAA